MDSHQAVPDGNEFRYERSRGIVWVCDLSRSSSYLNSQDSVDDLEQFLPRLMWVSVGLVEAAGGEWIKWTGDGFMAWFPTPLHRLVGERASVVFRAAKILTLIVNLTQLGLQPSRRFRIRHGVTFEQDALVIRFTTPDSKRSVDIIGRAVVLAFRLSGVESRFPGIVTQRELVRAAGGHESRVLPFETRRFSAEEVLKYFKGERWGTQSLRVSSESSPRRRTSRAGLRRTLAQIVKEGRRVLDRMDTQAPAEGPSPWDFVTDKFIPYMAEGPEWAQQTIYEFSRSMQQEFIPILRRMIESLSRALELETSMNIREPVRPDPSSE